MRLKLYRGKWAAVWREGTETRRISLRTADRSAAERRLADLEKTRRVEVAGNTIADAMVVYLKDKAAKPSHGAMEVSWKSLKPIFGHLRPDQVTRALCRSYRAGRKANGMSDGTVIKDLGVLKAALKWTKKDAGAEFELPPSPPPRDKFINREQFEKIVAAAEYPHIKLFILLAMFTAGRSAAILELTWDRVDFETGLIALGEGDKRAKGRATVPMNDRLRAALQTAAEARETGFVIEWAGRRVKSVKRGLAKACSDAGLPWVTAHVFRHSAARWMAERGVPMSKIAAYLGHSDSRITERVYAKYSPGWLKDAAGALE